VDTSTIQRDREMSRSEAAVRRFAEAINAADADAAVAVADPEIEFLSVLAVGGRPYVGHDGIRQYFADVASAWSRWTVEVHRVQPGADGRVAIAMTMHVVGQGERGGLLGEHRACLDNQKRKALVQQALPGRG